MKDVGLPKRDNWKLPLLSSPGAILTADAWLCPLGATRAMEMALDWMAADRALPVWSLSSSSLLSLRPPRTIHILGEMGNWLILCSPSFAFLSEKRVLKAAGWWEKNWNKWQVQEATGFNGSKRAGKGFGGGMVISVSPGLPLLPGVGVQRGEEHH